MNIIKNRVRVLLRIALRVNVFIFAFAGSSLVYTQSIEAQSSAARPRALPSRKQPSTKPQSTTDKSHQGTLEASTESEPETAEPSPADEIKSAELRSSSAVEINLINRTLNRSAQILETATVYVRDGRTGRIAQFELRESEPDSGQFSGRFAIAFAELKAMKPEFYLPDQTLLQTLAGRKTIAQKMKSSELRRLPFVFRYDSDRKVQTVHLFETLDEARAAFAQFQAEEQLLLALNLNAVDRNQTVEARNLGFNQAELATAEQFRRERAELLQTENRLAIERVRAYQALSVPQRKSQAQEAENEANQALLDYRAGRLEEARKGFERAIELNPSYRAFYFQYAVTLYKLEQFNRSLVFIELATDKDINAAEKEFYRGLNHYRLKDLASALISFKSSAEKKDPLISPSANFYIGVIQFERKRWSFSKDAFQSVLDTSADTQLDERAEAYIERILREQQIETIRQKQWILNGTFGVTYDDNVLLTSDSDRDRGTSTGQSAYRWLTQGSLRYRPVYEADREFAAQLDFLNMTSVDSSFQSVQSISDTDPTIIQLSFPMTYKGTLFGKGYKFDFTPGYEQTYMSIENSEWKVIFSSVIAGFQNLLIVNERWYSGLNLEVRQDNANLNSSTGDNNASALKTRVGWTNLIFAFDDKAKVVTTDLGYTQNNAVGKNQIFDRLDLGLGYITPLGGEFNLISRINYFLLTFPSNSSGRVDNSYALTLGVNKKILPWAILGVTGTHNINNSNFAPTAFRRTTVMATLTANNIF